MLEHFIARNLSTTVNFLLRAGVVDDASTVRISTLEQLAISHQNLGNHWSAYSTLLCPESRESLYKVVFCSCCSSTRTFIRNHSLCKMLGSAASGIASHSSLHGVRAVDPASSTVVKMPGSRRDLFLDFIEAKVSRDSMLAIDVINQVPLFWDAYLLLGELTNAFVHVESPLSSYFYMHLKIFRDLDPPGIRAKGCDIRCLPYKVENGNQNMLAAFHYCSGNSEEALRIFKTISASGYFDISYFEFYAMILYSRPDSSLAHLCENLCNFHKDEYETLVALGMHKSSAGCHEEARKLFARALRRKRTSDVQGLLAHACIKLNDYEGACAHLQEALGSNLNSFRALYAAAQGYFMMGRKEVSLWYCKRALEERSDGGLWKLMGRIHMALEEYARSLKCFEMAERMKEFDAILYMADVHKKMQKPQSALELYEKYVAVGEKNRATVAKYLVEYYEEQGNMEKSSFYRKFASADT